MKPIALWKLPSSNRTAAPPPTPTAKGQARPNRLPSNMAIKAPPMPKNCDRARALLVSSSERPPSLPMSDRQAQTPKVATK